MISIFRVVTALCALVLFALASQRPAAAAAAASITRATLANGLKIIVVRDPLAPVVSAILNYKAGGNEERFPGQAHALEHMMFRGSATVSQSQIADIADLLGGDWNADTQPEVTQYFFTAPAKYLDLVIRLEASRAKGLRLSQKDWDIERGAIENEVTQDDSRPFGRLFRKVDQTLFAGTPYSNDVLGTLNGFDHQVNAPQLRAFYDAYYHPNNAVYVIAGDVDPEKTIALVRHYFGSLPAVPLPRRRPIALQPLPSQTFTVDSDRPTTSIFFVYRFPGYADKDYAAGQILEAVLSNKRSDLYGLVASGQALGIGFEDYETHPKAGSADAYINVPVTTKPADAIAALRGVMDAYRAKGVPAALVEAEKRRAIAAAEYKANSIQGNAFAWSQAVAVQGYASPDAILTSYSSVTVDDVNRVLRQYVDSSHELIGVVAPQHTGAVAAAASGGSADAGSENDPTLLHHDPLPAWATAAFANVTIPAEANQPIDSTLPNGIRLIVVPQSISQTVVVRGSIASNEAMEAPAGLDGVAAITADLLPYGTAAYDRIALRTELDNIAAEIEPGTKFSLTARSADFDRGVELLAQEELHPAFPEAAFAAAKEKELGSARGVLSSPDHAATVALNTAIYPANDPALRFATPDTVGKVTLADVKAYYASVYRPDLTTIVVVGNVDPAHVRAEFEKEFGAWTAVGAKPDVDLPAVPNNATASVVVPDAEKIQSDVQLVQVAPFTRSDPDYAALEVANDAFGGSSGAILFHDVRDVHGLVYGVYSQEDVGKHRSTFAIRYACDPGKILPAQALIMSDLKGLAANGLSANDLLRGRVGEVSYIPLKAASFRGIANQLIEYAELGLPLDQSTIDGRNENAVTNADIKAAVNKWIRQGDFVRVIEGPAPPG